MTNEEREMQIIIANMLIRGINNLERPMLMYQFENDVAKEALENYIKILEQQPCEGMRDATEEERKSTKDYIDSISKPTGLQFDDIYEELDFVQPHKKISVNLQFCDDCISREEAIRIIKEHPSIVGNRSTIVQKIVDLPSVTPKTNVPDTNVGEMRESEDKNGIVIDKNLCDSCITKGCIFQSGIVRNHCDFYKVESEE